MCRQYLYSLHPHCRNELEDGQTMDRSENVKEKERVVVASSPKLFVCLHRILIGFRMGGSRPRITRSTLDSARYDLWLSRTRPGHHCCVIGEAVGVNPTGQWHYNFLESERQQCGYGRCLGDSKANLIDKRRAVFHYEERSAIAWKQLSRKVEESQRECSCRYQVETVRCPCLHLPERVTGAVAAYGVTGLENPTIGLKKRSKAVWY
ncbi:hypothetical protein J6590_036342 [Homalodisca vitripennis]|nr:hypothetical protein J6590_036342 [Homalodisca vitripennis]